MSDLYNATADIARVKWFDSQNWITPQNLFYWNGGSFVPSTNAKVWNGTSIFGLPLFATISLQILFDYVVF